MAGTTAQKLRAALTSKEGIRQAIETKGVPCGTDVPFADYGSKILSIKSGGDIYGPVGPGGSIGGVSVNLAGIGRYALETRHMELIINEGGLEE